MTNTSIKNEPNNVTPLSKWNSCTHAHTQNDHVSSEVKGFINSKIFE